MARGVFPGVKDGGDALRIDKSANKSKTKQILPADTTHTTRRCSRFWHGLATDGGGDAQTHMYSEAHS